MDEIKKSMETLEIETHQGSGSLLAAARKQQQKTVDEIASELNLSITQIKTIELDQTDGLPEPTYVRGYIRGYAKLLGLNPDDVLKSYLNPNWQNTSNLNDIPKGIGRSDQPSDPWLTPGKLILFILLAVIFGYIWLSGMLSWLTEGSSSSNLASSTSASQSAVVESISNQVGANFSNQDQVPSVGSRGGVSDLPNAAPDSADAGQPNQVPPTSSENANDIVNPDDAPAIANNGLVLTFTDTSWVDIRNEEDVRLAYRSFAEGEELRVSDATVLNVFIGNAAVVSVQYNGQQFDLTPHQEGVYAKFSVGNR
jgi:cytoskeleton protein RodZ